MRPTLSSGEGKGPQLRRSAGSGTSGTGRTTAGGYLGTRIVKGYLFPMRVSPETGYPGIGSK